MKLRFAHPINVLVGEIPGFGFARLEQRDGLGRFSLLEFRLRLQQHRLGHAVGFRIFLDELCELRFRAAPHPVLKRAQGGGVGAIFPPAGGENLSAAQKRARTKSKAIAAKRHASESKRRGAATKAGNQGGAALTC